MSFCCLFNHKAVLLVTQFTIFITGNGISFDTMIVMQDTVTNASDTDHCIIQQDMTARLEQDPMFGGLGIL